jgi:hypothetical protein
VNELRELVAAEGEAIAPALAARPGADVLGPLVTAAAPAEAAERAFVLETVLEGYLLHFGRSRLLDTDDADLRLLAGDYMYALGLSRLARLGDLAAVRVLADLITSCARHHASGAAHGAELAGTWVLAALAVARGPWPDYETALADDEEVSRMATEHGLLLQAQHALIAFREVATVEPRT